MPPIEFISGMATALVAIGTVVGAVWRMLMKKVRQIAKDEAHAIVEQTINKQISNVASKSAVEDLQKATQRITERIDELFTVLISNQHRGDIR